MTPYLARDIEAEEGRKLIAYRDSVGVLTIGVGHTQGVYEDQHISNATADGLLAGDIQNAIHALDKALPWWRGIGDEREDVLVAMCFQLGIGGLLKFTDTLKAMQRGDYGRAADCMLKSKWATHDTPARARRMAMQMRSGVRAWARAIQKTPTLGEPEQSV